MTWVVQVQSPREVVLALQLPPLGRGARGRPKDNVWYTTLFYLAKIDALKHPIGLLVEILDDWCVYCNEQYGITATPSALRQAASRVYRARWKGVALFDGNGPRKASDVMKDYYAQPGRAPRKKWTLHS